MASPFLGGKWGSVDHKILPPDAPSYVAMEKLATDFGSESASATLVLDGTAADDVGGYVADVEAVPGITAV